VWENMVDTNQEPVEKKAAAGKKQPVKKKEPVKKRNESPKKTAPKNKGEDKSVVKKLPVKKENTPAKAQGAPKAPVPAKKNTVANFKKFIKGAWSELKKVHWPNRRELVTFTSVVLVAVAFVAVLIFAVDSVLSKILEVIIPK